MDSPLGYYKERASFFSGQLNETKGRYRLVSFLRLASFVAFLIAGYQWLGEKSGVLLIITLLSIAVFIALIRVALKLNDKKALLEKLLFINENEIAI